jgi:hypothetical protein
MTHKFQAGDRVKIKATAFYAPGKTGTICLPKMTGTNLIAVDGRDKGHDGGGFGSRLGDDTTNKIFIGDDSLELLASTKSFIVVLRNKGKLLPATTPLTHGTREAAETEALRLAETKDGEFVVFQAVSTAKAPPRVATLKNL